MRPELHRFECMVTVLGKVGPNHNKLRSSKPGSPKIFNVK